MNKWHMNRFGLVDFWYYDYQEFNFKDGHMMLRGGNGSGKSVTMQSFLPLILDGNKSSSRLDPFGSRDRKIEDYLIDETGSRDDRIGYLFLEFKREDLEIYKTIGLGMQARKNTKMTTWYFVIEDNKRIGKDIHLFQKNLAITKQSLKNMIGDQLIESQGEYSRRVNEALFGFETEQEYKEVLDLMIQLRSPKLSNSLKPDKLNEILNNSLQPLSDEDLRPMTEAITSMDATKDQVLILEENIEASKKIIDVYDQYNYRMLYDKTKSYLDIQTETENILSDTKQALKEKEDAEIEKNRLERENINLTHTSQKIKDEKHNLLKEDLISLEMQLNHDKTDLKETYSNLNDKKQQLEVKLQKRTQNESDKRDQNDRVDQMRNKIEQTFEELNSLQEQLEFEEHIALKEEFLQNLNTPFNASFTNKRIEGETQSLQLGLERFDKIIRYEHEYNIYLNNLEREQAQQEQLELKLSKKQLEMKNTIEDTVVQYYQWNNNNKYLKIEIPKLESIVLDIERCETEDTSTTLRHKVHNEYSFIDALVIKEDAKLDSELKHLKEEENALKKALTSLNNKEKKSIQLDETTTNNRTLLKDLNIKHRTLYELLEFDDALSETERNQVEEKLRRTHFLFAQLINNHDFEKIKVINYKTSDNYLVTNNKVSSLDSFIITKAFIEQESWSSMFEYFGILNMKLDNINEHLVQNNLYVQISTEESAKYIGERAREAFRIQEIKRVQDEIEHVIQEITTILSDKDRLHQKRTTLKLEFDAMPKLNKIHDLRQNLKLFQSQIIEKVAVIDDYAQKLEAINVKTIEDRMYVTDIANRLGISAKAKAFKMRKEYLTFYKDSLQEMMNHHQIYLKDKEIYNKIKIDLDILEDDILILRDEVSSTERRLDRLNASIIQIEKQLEDRGYKEIKERLETINLQLEQYSQSILDNIGRIGALDNQVQNLTEKILEFGKLFDAHVIDRDQAEERYKEELNLAYVYEDAKPSKIIKHIKETYPVLKSFTELSANLQEVFILKSANLQEYSLRRSTIFSDVAMRFDISARYAGENVSIISLHTFLQKAIEDQKLLLEEKDRELIEEILINTISKKIRNRIQQSKAWVTRINRYMDNMNTSSGLKLSLNWQSRRADTDEELNSEKLVTFLERDVRLLKDADKEALLKHFTSKISLARKKADLEETQKSFHQIMGEIMDFRSWFDFKIMVQKQGERKKELTNNIFNTYSGGEKAMSMYIPLFSALAAKYESAKSDAPNIIALDEAFAGVDENNIDNMFELIRRFNFDYIMNSQVLWGDYPSVKGLAIYELFRPENAPYVTIVNYDWNGTTKRLVT